MSGRPKIRKWIRSAYTGKMVPLYEGNPYRIYPGMPDNRKITFEPESGIPKAGLSPNVRKFMNKS